MRTKQPIRAKRDHFMYLDSLESDDLVVEPVKVLIKQKQATVALSKAKLGHEPVSPTHSPISIFAPMSVQPPRMKLPEAVAKPSLPRSSVWPLAAAFPFGKRVWSSSRQHEVMEEWLDEIVLQKRAKMAFKGASEWPEKNRKEKTKHRCTPLHMPSLACPMRTSHANAPCARLRHDPAKTISNPPLRS